MRIAIKHLQSTTIDFLIKNICIVSDYQQGNRLLSCFSGIDTFFRNEEDFLLLVELTTPNFVISENVDKREYGDFQTPKMLSNYICSYLVKENIFPDIIVEPTFGKGAFVISALEYFPQLKRIYGVEINESYYWQTKFAILELFLKYPKPHKPKIFLYLDDVFKFNFKSIEKTIGNYGVLVLGNPPWITNSELGVLNSKNLPQKNNFKSLNGIEAITGKGNFDIGEYIILTMLDSFSKNKGHMAMLVKNSVIKNLVYDLPKSNYSISNVLELTIDTRKFFDASVEASLFKCSFGHNNSLFTCKVASLVSPDVIESEFGWIKHKFASNITLYKENIKYDKLSPYVWRQGIKHDCSKIMELDFLDGQYINGFGEKIDIEKESIYELVKSSDLDRAVIKKTRKYVILTQHKLGENTIRIKYSFPKTYQYLTKNKHLLEQRKSSIYKNKSPFAIFGIGDYSFKPYKVAISGLYKRSSFALILSENHKPIMLDDTCYFIGFDDIHESIFVWTILNSEYVQQLLKSIVFLDAKRPYTKDILMRISIDKIAQNMLFSEVVNQVISLNKDMLKYITESCWNSFLKKLLEKTPTNNQLSLFDIRTEQNIPLLI